MRIDLSRMADPRFEVLGGIGKVSTDIATLSYVLQARADESIGVRNSIDLVAGTAAVAHDGLAAALRVTAGRGVIRWRLVPTSAQREQQRRKDNGRFHVRLSWRALIGTFEKFGAGRRISHRALTARAPLT